MNRNDDQHWQSHNNLVKSKGLPPSAPLSRILKLIPQGPALAAADLGSGSGIDAFAMLERGWSVLAIDKDPGSLDHLRRVNNANLAVSLQRFEELELPALDLVNASMALPFCDPVHFDHCWKVISGSLSPRKGFFCGHLFGKRDSWSVRTDMTFFSRDALLDLFAGYNILWMEETEKNGKTVAGTSKHWHVFSVAAQRL